MRVRALTVLMLAVVGFVGVSAPRASAADPWPGTWVGPTPFAAPGGFARNYYVYEPSTRRPSDGRVPLLVYLHGCTQTAHDAAVGTRWWKLAEQRKFVLAFPEQNTDPSGSVAGTSNGSGCWNFFQPSSQQRGAGEPATIAGITKQVIASQNIDPRFVYGLGASAGADMAVNLGATYPDLYAAIGAFAGCPYKACTDLTGALAYEAMGSHARRMPVFVEDGTADPLQPTPVNVALVQQWLGTDDLVDDGLPNLSVPRTPASTTNHGLDPSILSGIGTPTDVCEPRNMEFPCPGGAMGFTDYPYTVQRYDDAQGEVAELWIIHWMMHDYPNGDPAGSFTDTHGPDLNVPAYDFFMAHPFPSAKAHGRSRRW